MVSLFFILSIAVVIGAFVILEQNPFGTVTPSPSAIPSVTPSPTIEQTETPTPTPTITATPSPSPTPTTTPEAFYKSTNWAGYTVSTDLQNPQPNITAINGSWTVPTVAPSTNDSYSAIWIGIGGRYDHMLIQCGTEQNSINGRVTYSAWYEMLPQSAVRIRTINVSPGDEMTASIQLLDGTEDRWQISITDITKGRSYQNTLTYNASQLSAEWIVERPKVDSEFSELIDFGEVTFTGCAASVDGVVASIDSFPFLKSIMFTTDEATTSSVQLTEVSSLSDDGSSFTVTYQVK